MPRAMMALLLVLPALATAAQSPDEALAARAREVLHQIVATDHSWVRIHAAEVLEAEGESPAMRSLFLAEAKTAAASPQRIGIWRILAATAPTDAERAPWIARIEAVTMDPADSDRLRAYESLGKLDQVIAGRPLEVARAFATAAPPRDRLLPLWVLEIAGDPSAPGRIADALASADPVARQRAAYALRWLRPHDPATLGKVARAAANEPPGTAAYPFLISTALALNADPAQAATWRASLERLPAGSSADARFEASQALMPYATAATLPRIAPLLDDPDPNIRVGAAWTILAALAPENQIVLTIEATPEHPRNTEGSFAQLKSGRIIFCYSQFYGGSSDFSHARIAEVDSDDEGRTWTSPRVIVDNGANLNVMSESLLRLASGRLALFYAIKRTAMDCRPVMCVSDDEGATWSAPKLIIDPPGYFVLNNDRVIQTASGRLIVPVALHRPLASTFRGPGSIDSHGIVLWYYSDDEGATWKESTTWWALPVASTSGLQEPGVVELADGSLFSWSRTDVGEEYCFCSRDGGTTWSAPQPTALKSPLSPASIKRLPHSSALLAIYNDHSGRFSFLPEMRAPLVAAISTDGGRTWPRRRLLDGSPEHKNWYCYTATCYVGDTVLVAYWVYDGPFTPDYIKYGRPSRLRIRRVALSWLDGAQ